VESESGKGTTVSITIPIVRSTPELEHRALYGDSKEPGGGGGDDTRAGAPADAGSSADGREGENERESESNAVQHGTTDGTGGSE
jgi:hypothetical protein